MGPKALQFIHAIARKFLAKEGKGITSIANRMQAEAKASEIAETFRLSGLTPNKWDEFIKSENDVVKYLNIIESSKKPKIKQSIQPKPLMQSSKPGDVIDFPPERITDWTKARPQPPEIEMIDGVQTTRGMGDLFSKQMRNIGKKDPALYEDRGGNIIPAQFKDTTVSPERVAQGFSTQMKLNNAETNKRLAQDLIQGKSSEFNNLTMEAKSDIINKINIEIKKEPQKFYQGGQAEIEPSLSDIGHGSDALMARNALLTPGSQATTSTGLNYLLGEDNDTTRVPYAQGNGVADKDAQQKKFSERVIKLMDDEGYEFGEAVKEAMKEGYAEGGPARQNFGIGGMSKRAFLKWLGSGAAGIAGLKTGLLGFGKKSAVKSVIAPATQAANEAAVPPYFLNLVRKIKNLGDDVTQTQSLAERQKVTKFKDFELTEDLATGRQEITRYKVDEGATHYGQPLTEETYMSYTPGEIIKGKKGKLVKTKPEYDEGTAYLRSDREFAGDIVDESATISDDVIKEGTIFEDTIAEFTKKAEGGRVPMWLGGGLTAGKGLTREMLKFMAKGSSHGKSPAEMLKMLNPKQFEKFLNDSSLTNKFSKDTGIMASDMVKDMIKKTKTDRTDMIEQLISSARNIKKGDDNILTYKNKIIEEMIDKGMDRKTAETLSETLSESLLKEVGPKGAGPKVTEQGLLELENIQKNLLTKDRQLQADGGRIGYGKGKIVTEGIPALIKALLKNKKKVKQAVDDIYPTGDYKYDAEMAADALVENNPKTFKGLLREDLDDLTRSEVYGAVLGPIQNNALMVSRMKKATKPTKTLEGIEKTGTIDISNPGIADEFTRFMKETNPKGYKDIEEKIILESFDPKGKKGHATGGRVSLSGGGLAGMLGE